MTFMTALHKRNGNPDDGPAIFVETVKELEEGRSAGSGLQQRFLNMLVLDFSRLLRRRGVTSVLAV
eukprot:m.32545 g.32545  ORF g.32545 m.32545 type:complete len:66 (+) comp12159_c0_seq2:438-635(+)